jgi:LysR family cys regulon transcriptional activator
MELRQLRSLVGLVDADFSVSRAAERLHLVQPAVSQHLKALESELGVPLFRRQGKRLVALTPAGEQALHHARRALADVANIHAIGEEQCDPGSGDLRIGATHTQARYVLPPVLRRFTAAYPQVALQLHQGTPQQLVEMALDDRVDLAICTEELGRRDELTAIPSYRWNRCLIAPTGHPILAVRPITLELLCEYPLVTYVFGFTGRGRFSNAFAREGLEPRIVLGAADTDIIKVYVREGMGVGIIADIAYHPDEDTDLGARSLSHLFPDETTRIAHHKHKMLRGFQRHFIECFQEQGRQMRLISR